MSPRPLDARARERIGKILVIKWGAMGDLAICSTIFEDIRRGFPAAEIHLNTAPAFMSMFHGDERFSRLIPYDRRSGLRGMLAWVRAVRAEGYDMIIDLQSIDRSRLLLLLLRLSGNRTPHVVGTSPSRLCHHYPTGIDNDVALAIDFYRATIECLGIPATTPRPSLRPTRDNQRRVEALLREHGLEQDGFYLFMPGCQARGHLKRWGAGNYAALAERLHRETGYPVVLAGGPDDASECRAIATAAPSAVIDLCGRTRILDLVPLAAAARHVVANDTGTAHIAAATETPILVVCGPTDPHRVRPVGEQVLAIQANVPCRNCYCKRDCDHHRCMTAITPDTVLRLMREHRENRDDVLLLDV